MEELRQLLLSFGGIQDEEEMRSPAELYVDLVDRPLPFTHGSGGY